MDWKNGSLILAVALFCGSVALAPGVSLGAGSAAGVRVDACGRRADSRLEKIERVLPLDFGLLVCVGRDGAGGVLVVAEDLVERSAHRILHLDERAAWGDMGPRRITQLAAAAVPGGGDLHLVVVTTSAFFGNAHTIYGRNRGHVLLLGRGEVLAHRAVEDLGSADLGLDLASGRWQISAGALTDTDDARGYSDVVGIFFEDLDGDGLTEAVLQVLRCESPARGGIARTDDRCEPFLQATPPRYIVVRPDLTEMQLVLGEAPDAPAVRRLESARPVVLDF